MATCHAAAGQEPPSGLLVLPLELKLAVLRKLPVRAGRPCMIQMLHVLGCLEHAMLAVLRKPTAS